MPSDKRDLWIKANWPAPANVQAGTTTRREGVSEPPYAALNLGAHVGDDVQRVAMNRRRLRYVLALPGEPHWLSQCHGVRVIEIGRERDRECDGAWTDRANVVCAVLTADCLPVLLCNTGGTCVAALHAGWRGLAHGIIESGVAAVDCEPQELLAWLGPAIGPRAFEVGAEVRSVFMEKDPAHEASFSGTRNGRWLCDLYEAARITLRRLGVTSIFGGDHCTFTDAARFYSYRRDGRTGRMASLIWIDARGC
jgi:hypothetical protein